MASGCLQPGPCLPLCAAPRHSLEDACFPRSPQLPRSCPRQLLLTPESQLGAHPHSLLVHPGLLGRWHCSSCVCSSREFLVLEGLFPKGDPYHECPSTPGPMKPHGAHRWSPLLKHISFLKFWWMSLLLFVLGCLRWMPGHADPVQAIEMSIWSSKGQHTWGPF
jgi:hypothetical protein